MTFEEYVELEAAAVSSDERKQMPDSDFAVPGKRKLIISDATHVKLAWDMVDRTKDLTPEERSEARSRILHKAKKLGIDTSNWTHSMKAAAVQFSFSDTTGNPNKMPFKGVLTYLDAASDKPPGGSGGRKVLIPSSVGIPALESLKGMGVNLASEMDDHQVTHKIGVITDAYTGQLTAKGLEVIVEGHIFARDFPREAAMIKLNQSNLGFSYETANTLLASQEVNGEEVAVAQSLVFTGAAILCKNAAAYQSTSIAASANQKEDTINVTTEELKALFGEFKTEILASVDSKLEGVKEELKASASAAPTEPSAIATEPAVVNASAEINVEDIVAKAVAAALAAQKPIDVTASAEPTSASTPVAPQRKSFAPGTLLAKYDVKSEGEDLYASIDRVAEKAGLDISTRMAMKLQAWSDSQVK